MLRSKSFYTRKVKLIKPYLFYSLHMLILICLIVLSIKSQVDCCSVNKLSENSLSAVNMIKFIRNLVLIFGSRALVTSLMRRRYVYFSLFTIDRSEKGSNIYLFTTKPAFDKPNFSFLTWFKSTLQSLI